MKILVLGLNYAPEKTGIGVYTTGMAEALAAWGHEVHVIVGQPYYPAWKVIEGFSRIWYGRAVEDGVDVTRVPHYVPARPSGAKRLLHYLSFALTSFFPLIWRALTFRPDVVLAVAPSLMAAPGARLAAGLCGARSWLHLQDFEVEAAFATGLLKRKARLGGLALAFESAVLKRFDLVSTISPQMCAKLVEKGVSPDALFEFRNWADVSEIRPLDRASISRDAWGITTKHVALYSGTIGNKQGMEIIVDAARLLAHRADLTFIICGEGPNRAALQRRAEGLTNIQFRDLQPSEQLNDLLGLASVHLLPQLAGAADLVLPSKLCNMLASERPVIATAAANTGLAIEVAGCGLVTEPENVELFASAITRLLDDETLRRTAGAQARQRAEERWDRGAILRRLEARLARLVAGRSAQATRDAKAPAP